MSPVKINYELVTMDSADPVMKAISSHGALLGQHEQILQALCESSQHMAAQVSELLLHLSRLTGALHNQLQPQSASAETQSVDEAQVSDPEPFDGTLGERWGFFLQCSIAFRQWPRSFLSDQAKAHYVLRLLRGRALT